MVAKSFSLAGQGMNSLSLSSLMGVRLALVLSLSFTAYSFSPKLKPSFPLSLSHSSPAPVTVATAGDVLSLLGPRDQASNVDPHVAQELWSCFKFLVPFDPTADGKRRSMANYRSSCRREKENQLIWWPPGPVKELARLAFDSGGDADSVHRALDPSIIPVPDVEGSKENKCELTRTPYGRRFINEELNSYLKFLFEMIVSRGPSVGLNVSLSRYDLFHSHLFLAKDTGRLGILFHAKEYPAYDEGNFPLNLGYCQRDIVVGLTDAICQKGLVGELRLGWLEFERCHNGSKVVYDDTMNLRNILWLAPLPSNSSEAWLAPGVLVDLDAHPEGIIYRDLIPDDVQIVRTLYEDDFGEHAVDINYLNVGSASPDYQIFIC